VTFEVVSSTETFEADVALKRLLASVCSNMFRIVFPEIIIINSITISCYCI
jgi:hypothetical protein